MRTLILSVLVAALLVPLAFGDTEADRKTYTQRSKSLEKDDLTGRFELGLWCEKAGLDVEARAEFERVVALSPGHEGARRALGYEKFKDRWLSHGEAMREKGLVLHEGSWLLPEQVRRILLPATEREKVKADQARVRKYLKAMLKDGPKAERMAMKAMESVADENKVEPLAYALRYPSESVRLFAAKELGRIGDRRAIRPLVYRSLMDTSESVREASVTAVKAFADPNRLAPYVKALASENQNLRMNSARAIGDLGDIIGIEYLVYKLRYGGGGIGRNSLYIANQLSFIQDFDVEVAQTAFIADPMVGIIQEGATLDVKVNSLTGTGWLIERRVIRNALAKLSGVDLGDDALAWAKWWSENKSELVKNG